jgi:hypothetical protein
MATEITLTGPVQYHPSYPPKNAKKGYVARITGRAPGAVKYAREFLGSEVTLLEGDEGLYERQIGDKKGGHTRYYHVILSHPEHGLIRSRDCEDEVPRIAKLLDDGVPIQDAVEITELAESERTEGLMLFTAVPRAKAAAKKAAAAAGIDDAVEQCWAVLSVLSERDRKKAITALRKRATAPTA